MAADTTSAESTIVTFNVGGTCYQVSRSLLDQFPHSMLSKSTSEQWQKDPNSEIFIERDGARFKYVLDYMRDGKVDVPLHETKTSILAELEYFGIDVADDNSVNYPEPLCSMNGYLEFKEYALKKKHGVTLAMFILNELSKESYRCFLKPGEEKRINVYPDIPDFKPLGIRQYEHSIPEANDILKNGGLKIKRFLKNQNGLIDGVCVTLV
jgi:K+ channel tetramerisation domain.